MLSHMLHKTNYRKIPDPGQPIHQQFLESPQKTELDEKSALELVYTHMAEVAQLVEQLIRNQ